MSENSGTGWIQNLNKQQLISELKKRNVEYSESDKFENLRSELRAKVKVEIESKRNDDSGKSGIIPNSSSSNENIPEKVEPAASTAKPVLNTSESSDNSYAGEQESDNESTMSGDNTKLEFALGKDDWETFQERLEFFFISKDITGDKKKVATVLTRKRSNYLNSFVLQKN